MRFLKLRILGLILCLLSVVQLISCEYITSLIIPNKESGEGSQEITTSPDESNEESRAPGESETLDPGRPITLPTPSTPKDYINPLTGLPSAFELSEARAIAFVINNSYLSFTQSGIAKADVLCEYVLPDGNTSLMAIFKDASEVAVIDKFLVNFERKVSDEYYERAEVLG